MADYRCSFCGKSQDDVRKLIAGPKGVAICDECVALCKEIADEDLSAPRPEPTARGSTWLDRLRRMAVSLPR